MLFKAALQTGSNMFHAMTHNSQRSVLRMAFCAAFLALIQCPKGQAQDVPTAPDAAAATEPPVESPQNGPAEPALERNPAVRAALALPREEPADYFRAISWLIDLGRPQLAAPILEELRGLELNDAQRAELVSEFGSHRMLQLAQTEELAPSGVEFAEACMTAAGKLARDPERLAQLVDELASPAAEVRHAARVDLVAAGQAGVNATLEALARATDPQHRAALMAAATRMEPLVVGPLLGMLTTNDPTLKSDVAQLLMHLQVGQAIPLLPEANPLEQERRLARALARYRAGTPPFAPDEESRVALWHWDDTANSLRMTLHPADEARNIWMSRLARELAQLRPSNRAYRRQAVVLLLEAKGLMALADTPATGSVAAINLAAAKTPLLNDAMADALAGNYSHAAVALAEELSRRRDDRVLYTSDGQPSPLAEALEHPDRRVRFAALRAIMALDPASPYPGSSRVPETLAYFATSSGARRALVAMPTAARATDLAGALAAHGLEGQATNKGIDAVELGRQISDLEMMFIDMDLQAPGVREVVYELRIHPASGAVPIALLAAEARLGAAHRLADEHEAVIAVPRPHSDEVLSRIVEELTAAQGREFPTPNERASQAILAVTWLAKLLASDRDFYALRRHTPAIEGALYRTAATDQAIAALENIGTHNSQLALVDYASQNMLPAESRLAAAGAFQRSIEAHGVLLTTDEILTQYDRYNASATADSDTQQLLSALLDAIESRRDESRVAP